MVSTWQHIFNSRVFSVFLLFILIIIIAANYIALCLFTVGLFKVTKNHKL